MLGAQSDFLRKTPQLRISSMVNLEALLNDVDDFCKTFEPEWQKRLIECASRQQRRDRSLTMSEVMTILILFQVTGYRDFKTFYTQHVCRFLTWEFSRPVTYMHMQNFKKDCLNPLCAYLTSCKVQPTCSTFIDVTKTADTFDVLFFYAPRQMQAMWTFLLW